MVLMMLFFGSWCILTGIGLDNPAEARTIGWDDLLGMPNTLVCAEWAERFRGVFAG